MDDFWALQKRTMQLFMSTAQANADAMTTIALRLPMLAQSGLTTTGPSKEARKMVTEKLEAVIEGSFKGTIASGELALRAMMGQLNPTTLAIGMVEVAQAVHRPAQISVKANAKRLTRK